MTWFQNRENIESDLHSFNAGISGLCVCFSYLAAVLLYVVLIRHHGHIGFDFKLPNGGSFIEAGGNYGFIDIQKNEQTERNSAGAPRASVQIWFT
jgi:hypothetical protein